MSYVLYEFLTSGEWRQPRKQLWRKDQLDFDNNVALGIVTRFLQASQKRPYGKTALPCSNLAFYDLAVRSASQAQNHSNDCDQQEHEDQATDHWSEGNMLYISHVAVKQSQNVDYKSFPGRAQVCVLNQVQFFWRRKHFYVLTTDQIWFENANKFNLSVNRRMIEHHQLQSISLLHPELHTWCNHSFIIANNFLLYCWFLTSRTRQEYRKVFVYILDQKGPTEVFLLL